MKRKIIGMIAIEKWVNSKAEEELFVEELSELTKDGLFEGYDGVWLDDCLIKYDEKKKRKKVKYVKECRLCFKQVSSHTKKCPVCTGKEFQLYKKTRAKNKFTSYGDKMSDKEYDKFERELLEGHIESEEE